MEKYYTPTIEEFYIGFEFEKHDKRHARYEENEYKPTNWHKHKYNRDSIRLSQLDTHLHEKTIRVKYLDQEDIEDCGFELHSKGNIVDRFTMRYSILIVEKSGKLRIWDVRDLKDLFIGTIKNKSELKKLINQLGI